MTIHAAKGLEFSSVFESRFRRKFIPLRYVNAKQWEDLEEERRLFYKFAVTRAGRF